MRALGPAVEFAAFKRWLSIGKQLPALGVKIHEAATSLLLHYTLNKLQFYVFKARMSLIACGSDPVSMYKCPV
jgi:hypothetical protein